MTDLIPQAPTSGGVPLTESLLDELVAEAERGYPASRLRVRGRPRLGVGPSEIVPVRLDPDLRRALADERRARRT